MSTISILPTRISLGRPMPTPVSRLVHRIQVSSSPIADIAAEIAAPTHIGETREGKAADKGEDKAVNKEKSRPLPAQHNQDGSIKLSAPDRKDTDPQRYVIFSPEDLAKVTAGDYGDPDIKGKGNGLEIKKLMALCQRRGLCSSFNKRGPLIMRLRGHDNMSNGPHGILYERALKVKGKPDRKKPVNRIEADRQEASSLSAEQDAGPAKPTGNVATLEQIQAVSHSGPTSRRIKTGTIYSPSKQTKLNETATTAPRPLGVVTPRKRKAGDIGTESVLQSKKARLAVDNATPHAAQVRQYAILPSTATNNASSSLPQKNTPGSPTEASDDLQSTVTQDTTIGTASLQSAVSLSAHQDSSNVWDVQPSRLTYAPKHQPTVNEVAAAAAGFENYVTFGRPSSVKKNMQRSVADTDSSDLQWWQEQHGFQETKAKWDPFLRAHVVREEDIDAYVAHIIEHGEAVFKRWIVAFQAAVEVQEADSDDKEDLYDNEDKQESTIEEEDDLGDRRE